MKHRMQLTSLAAACATAIIAGSAAMVVAPAESRAAGDANDAKVASAAKVVAAAKPPSEEAESLYVRRIAPLVHEKCLACHGQDEKKIKSGFDMRSFATVMRGGESGQPAIVPGYPDKSPLFLSVTRAHEDWSAMPPKDADKLSNEQVDWIKQWIAGGAPWPDEARIQSLTKSYADKWSAEDGVTVKTSGGLSSAWTDRKYKPEGLWAYQPLKSMPPPSPDRPIDGFIEAAMPKGLPPAPPADRVTLLRRASFDLTGLPPTSQEVSSFVNDARPLEQAFASVVDRLLDSPHYGERMAQHWLDVVRYADSSGFANDYERGNAWRYRDYVVRSFNADKPYDQFVREQIAGDEIDPQNPDNLIAVGMLRMGPWELTGMEVAKVARQRFLDDVTNSVGETFLATSLQCARCHDHKFDPIPTRDYYSIQAVFGTTQLTERPAPFMKSENVGGFEEKKYLEARKLAYQATLNRLDEISMAAAQKWFQEKNVSPAKWLTAVEKAKAGGGVKNAMLKKPGGAAAAAAAAADPDAEPADQPDPAPAKGTKKKGGKSGIFSSARSILLAQGVPEDQFPPKYLGFAPEDFGNDRVARKGLERLAWEMERYEPMAFSVYDGATPQVAAVTSPMRMPADPMNAGKMEPCSILMGGDPFSPGPAVQPGTLSMLGSPHKPLPEAPEGRRRAFADWVASPDNALAIRTVANRLWLWHFDQAIAGNPNNFGSTGKRPTHPELLDWLAATLVRNDWSFKAMHRLIMNSDVYRRGSTYPDLKLLAERDPTGSSYAVFKPRRLTGEELRDAMLLATGELNPQLGGIPNRPEINLEAALQPRQVMGTFASAWTPNPRPEERNRRSLYALKLRGLRDPFLEVFNEPAPDFSCERREASTVTPQVFSLFNGKASNARALALANRAVKETPGDAEAVRRCFELAYERQPTAAELQACLDHWKAIEAMIADEKPERVTLPLEVRRDAVEENTGEKFSFQEKLQANADFVPDLQAADVPVHTRALADVCLVLMNSNEFSYVY